MFHLLYDIRPKLGTTDYLFFFFFSSSKKKARLLSYASSLLLYLFMIEFSSADLTVLFFIRGRILCLDIKLMGLFLASWSGWRLNIDFGFGFNHVIFISTPHLRSRTTFLSSWALCFINLSIYIIIVY